MDDELRYPVGKWDRKPLADDEVPAAIDVLAALPEQLRAAIAGLDETQLDTPYRAGGWTVRQVVHHVPDSHMNAYVRCRLALTEDEPTIRTYEEARWAELPDAQRGPVEMSLRLLAALHERWVTLLRALRTAELDRTFRHPELGAMPLRALLGLYAWHSRHHLAHVTRLRERQGW